MIYFLIILLAALLDGISTVWFLKKYPTSYETNPILGKRPSTVKIFLVGTAYVALWAAAIHWVVLFRYIALVASGYHIKCAQNNFGIEE